MVSFVATPIGNLGDITYRAVETLKNAYEIRKPLYACHKFNERQAAEKIAMAALSGKNVAVVSDAGMPVVSDPGNIVCAVLKEKGVSYTVIPGANAALCALILSGLPADKFLFVGFLLFHEAPQDIDGDVRAMYEAFGERRAAAVREITKIHEECTAFRLSEGLPGEKRGEYVLVVAGAEKRENPLCALTEKEHILHYMRAGYEKKEAVKMAAKDRGVTKSELYPFSVDLSL